ncbi:GNAT family N-acetyltransferase [Actinoplanes sp. NPDC051859]|uniref:GNAT family N-acetyltransferase n=1 Tax=Actinoplanes sp. NPDC051859 TaxID=3363909 RepID=UPI00379FC0E2
MQPSIRAYRPSDLAAVYDICVRTADAGGDARGKYTSDTLMGDIFAAPYAVLEPEHAHVLDDGTGAAVGYVVGTADTVRFAQHFRTEWLPVVTERYPEANDPRVTLEDGMLALLRHPERMVSPELAGYPAHLHIDLLPEWQGRGQGRGLIAAFLDGLRAAGVPRVHLGMARTNTAARAFYDRLGFVELSVPGAPDVTFMGRETKES